MYNESTRVDCEEIIHTGSFSMTKFKQYLAGMKAEIPVIFGFIPVGITYALMARQAGLTVFQT